MLSIHSQEGELLGWYRLALASLLSLVLGACGGGGGATSSSYTIGGNLTGLASGQQITLQNNGTDTLTLSNDGPFTFSSQVANGGNYSVTVATQQIGEACVVTNGTGASIGASVSNVTVTCSTQTYTFGGNLVGLASGQQVTLQNSGTDPLTLTADGSFTFSTQSAYGSTYSITVSSQPNQASQQLCSVNSGSGTITGAVTNVQVACNTESVLYNFTSANSGNGEYPVAGLIMDSAGNLYGTTKNGGSSDFGTVFELSRAAGGAYIESVLYSFPGQPITSDGIYPTSGVIMDSAGNLYGTTTTGGSGGFGVVFKLSPSAGGGYTESVLHTFDGSTADAGEPAGNLIMDGAGNLYGTTRVGGTGQSGVVFKLSPSTGGAYTESILYSFGGGDDGGRPEGGLIMDSAGNLYGTTSSSGNSGLSGTVFRLAPVTGGGYTEKTLHSFSAANDGAAPAAGLIMDSAGNLYGTTRLGSGNLGNGNGTVFKLSRPTSGDIYTESILYSFTGGGDGAQPVAGLIMDSAGNLYGTASAGGSANCNNGCGTVFKLSPASPGYTESVLFSFTGGSGGAGPTAGMIMDSAGNLYGTTNNGYGAGATGGADAGNVFEILLH